MSRMTTFILATGLLVAGAMTTAEAQGRYERRSRQEIARAQGVPPGQLPPTNLCRVWYDNRPNGQQPDAMNCRQAEAIAWRDRNARVIYGENVYDARYASRGRYPEDWARNDDYDDRGVSRPGRVRDPRYAGGIYDAERSRYTTPAFQSGYRDGLQKGREDARDRDRLADPNRHSWYRNADRGYEDEYGSRSTYRARYRDGFEAGYVEGFRAYRR